MTLVTTAVNISICSCISVLVEIIVGPCYTSSCYGNKYYVYKLVSYSSSVGHNIAKR